MISGPAGYFNLTYFVLSVLCLQTLQIILEARDNTKEHAGMNSTKPDERSEDHVYFLSQTKLDIGLISCTQGGKINRGIRQVDPLVGTKSA